MRINPITTPVSNAYYSKNRISNPQSNVNFTSTTGTILLIKYLRQGYNSVSKGKDKLVYLKELRNCLNSSEVVKYQAAIYALARTADSYYDYHHQGSVLWIDRDNTPYMDDFRYQALRKISQLPDANHEVVQAKKEFLRSFFTNGHEISALFIEKFAQLNDSYYTNFKREIIDTCLFSDTYKRIRGYVNKEDAYPREYTAGCDPFNKNGRVSDRYEMYCPDSNFVDRSGVFLEQAYNNLKLISTLDKVQYKNFIASRRDKIEEMKTLLENYFYRVEEVGCSYKIPEVLREYNTKLKNI